MKKYYIKLFLCIISGPIGLHNWYDKNYKKAIIYLLTYGGFGIWYIYDIINILKNKNSLSVNNISTKDIKNSNIMAEKKEIKIDKTEHILSEDLVKNTDMHLETECIHESKKLSQEIDDILNKNLLKDVNLYLESFNNIKKYDLNKELEDTFLKKIKRVKEVDYEKFTKPSGTTNRPMDFVVFDLETTGLSPISNEIIEIGAVRFKTHKPVEVFHTYIKPRKEISPRITSINGITNEMVENSPTIDDILPRFIDFIGDDVLVAHNSDFDMGFILNQLYNQNYKKIKNKAIDTLKLSRQKVREYDYGTGRNKKLDSYKLEDLKYEFGLWGVGSHNAIDDCKVCAFVYMKIINEYGDFCYIN